MRYEADQKRERKKDEAKGYRKDTKAGAIIHGRHQRIPMTFNTAEAALSQLLDDPYIERIYLTNGRRIEELKK